MNRSFFLLLLSLLLGACTLFHPYRLPSPPVPPELKAQRKAAAKAGKERARQSKHAAKTDGADAAPAASPTAADGTAAKTAEPRPKAHYDKNGLLKKPKLNRRRYHKSARKPFQPFQALGNLFHHKSHAKPKPKAAPSPTE